MWFTYILYLASVSIFSGELKVERCEKQGKRAQVLWRSLSQRRGSVIKWYLCCSLCPSSSELSSAIRAHYEPVTRPCIVAQLLSYTLGQTADQILCCGKEAETVVDLPRSLLVNSYPLVNYPSFLPVIVSIDTTRHLTPTGLHNLGFLPSKHKSTHIQRHQHTHTHTHIPYHRTPCLALPQVLLRLRLICILCARSSPPCCLEISLLVSSVDIIIKEFWWRINLFGLCVLCVWFRT